MDTGVPDSIDPRARSVVESLGVSRNVRLAEQLVSEAIGLITDEPDTLDLKIATAALAAELGLDLKSPVLVVEKLFLAERGLELIKPCCFFTILCEKRAVSPVGVSAL